MRVLARPQPSFTRVMGLDLLNNLKKNEPLLNRCLYQLEYQFSIKTFYRRTVNELNIIKPEKYDFLQLPRFVECLVNINFAALKLYLSNTNEHFS